MFSSSATNLVPGDVNGRRDVFRYERGSGRIVRISVDSDGRQANDHSAGGVPSDDGAFCAFDSDASDLVDNDHNGAGDVFVHEDTTRDVVFPLQRRNVAGNWWTDLPFDRADLRLQQCARESRGRPALIRNLSFRRDDRGDQAAAVARRMEVELSMGPADIDAMTTRFASNWSGRATTVVTRKEVYLPDWTTAPVGLSRFEATIPLDMPYDHSGAEHLLWELRVFDNSATGRYSADAHDGLISVDSSSQVLGVGCETNAGYPFSHTLVYYSSGPQSSISVTGARATRGAPVTLMLGTIDPNYSHLLCTGLRTDAALQLPIGLADANGDVAMQLLMPPWDPSLQGAVVYSQLVAPDALPSRVPIVLSNGRRVTWPTTNPGPAMRRVVGASSGAETGTLEDTGAVFKVGG